MGTKPTAPTLGQTLVDLDIADERASIRRLQTDICKLQADVHKHEERILELKNERNAMSPIAKLPPDIMEQIFRDVQSSCMTVEHGVRKVDEKAQFAWRTILHVCRYWRTFVIDTPTMWTTIASIARYHQCELYLRRSVTAPLDVSITLDSHQSDLMDITQSIMYHITRVRAMEVGVPKLSMLRASRWTRLQRLLESTIGDNTVSQESHGILEALHVDFSWQDVAPKLSPGWFTIAPRLQHLTLNNVNFDWDSIPLPNIRALYVDFPHSATPMGFNQLQNSLRKMDLVQALCLFNLPLQYHDGALRPTPSSKFTLPCLKVLKLEASSSVFIASLLSTVSFHRPLESFHAHIARSTEASDIHGDAGLFQALSGIPLTQHRYKRMDIRAILGLLAIMLFMDSDSTSTYESRLDYKSDSAHFALSFPIHDPESTVTPQSLISSFYNTGLVNLSSLTQLHVETRLETQTFVSAFGSLPHLAAIDIMRESTLTMLIEALLIPIDQPLNVPVTFPALKCIQVSSFGLVQFLSDHRTQWNAFLDCLMQRCEYGVPIDYIQLDIYNQFPKPREELQALCEIVPEVLVFQNGTRIIDMYG